MRPPPIALPEPLPVGDRYLLVRRLAMGGVADIFLARQSATAGFEKEVVIKRLRPELRGNAAVVKRFLEEARIGALLNHPNVVHVYDVDVADGAPYIAMEYIEGGELGALCRRGLAQGSEGGGNQFLPFPHAVELMRQAAAGLGYLHAKRSADGQPLGIVHRDISPQNLLITEEGFLKIIDFGIAKTRRTEAATDRVLPGKLGYMAPEQVAQKPVDPRADIFSLGVVLYELTLGRRLFKGPAHEVVRRISAYEIEPPTFVRRSYPAALEQIVMKALARDPQERYQSAYDLSDALEEFLHTAKLASGPVRVARYLDELGHAEGKTRRPELKGAARPGSEADQELFSSFRAAPGREWDDAEEPIADVASALGIGVEDLRSMRVPAGEPSAEGRSGRARRATDLRLRAEAPPASAPVNGSHVLPMGLGADEPKAEGKPEPEARLAAKAEATVEEKAADAKADAKTDGKADAKTEAKIDAKADGKAEAKTEAKIDAKTEAKLDAKVEALVATPAALSIDPRDVKTDEVRAVSRGADKALAEPSGFGAALLHRAPPPHPRWVVIGISVAAALFLLYLIAS